MRNGNRFLSDDGKLIIQRLLGGGRETSDWLGLLSVELLLGEGIIHLESIRQVAVHLLVFWVGEVGVVPIDGLPVPPDKEFLEVPGDVPDLEGLVKEPVGVRERAESRLARFPQILVETDRVDAVDVDLPEELSDVGFEVISGPHVANSVEDLGPVRPGLLHPELVAGKAEDDEVRVLRGECIYLDVGGRGQASVGRHVEDQHDFSLVPGEGNFFTLVDVLLGEVVDSFVGGDKARNSVFLEGHG